MMKRRPFLASLATLGATSIVSLPGLAKKVSSNSQNTLPEYWQEDEQTLPQILKKLENELIAFTWFSDASATLLDKKSNTSWAMSPVAYQEEDSVDRGHVWVRQERSMCDQYPGRFRGELQGEDVKFTVLGLAKKIKGTFVCNARLENEFLFFQIKNIDNRLPNLMFPPHLESSQLVLPIGIGKLIRKPLPSRYFHAFFTHLNMRWFGGLKEDGKNGWMAIYEENFENGGLSASGLALVPAWQKSLGKWENSRTIKYTFTQNGYVQQAKTYRKHAQKIGLFKTLDTKIKETPTLKNMVGGRLVSLVAARAAERVDMQQDQLQPVDAAFEKTVGKLKVLNKFSTMPSSIAQLKQAGMKSGIINIRGWGKGGYDYGHPDIWPPSPEVGTADELKKACNAPEEFTVVLHDNYQDTYEHNPSFPKGINIRQNGEYLVGGYWDPGQSYILNSKASIEFAKRNWDQIKQVAPKGMFVDTTTAMQLYESFEAGNTQTRKQDLERKIELIKFYKAKGLIFGSEESADFGIPHVDWMECRHKRVVGESIPLWPLVFHDCVMMGRYISMNESLPSEIAKSQSHPKHLEDMLWGYFMLYWGQSEANNIQLEAIKATMHVDDWFGKIATAEMANHEFLTEDFMVERTTFANGKSITINFSNEQKSVPGISLKAYEYKILG